MMTKANKAAIKAAMQESVLFLVTGAAESAAQRDHHRAMACAFMRLAMQQALLAGEQAFALRLHDMLLDLKKSAPTLPNEEEPRATLASGPQAAQPTPSAALGAPGPAIAPPAAQAPAKPKKRRVLRPQGSPGQRARDRMHKRGAITVTI